MKFLVIGCGSIGERHIKNLNSLRAGKILAYDINLERLHLMKKKYNVNIFSNVENAFDEKPDAVLICTPPNLHTSMAIKSVDHDAHIFIEKPISNNFKRIDDFLAKAKKKKLIVLVGYNLRFHPGIKLMRKMIVEGSIGRILSVRSEAGQFLPDWKPAQDYRQSYTAKNEMGGGIILDGSHEIDYIYWILGEIKKVFCFADKVSNLDVNVEDIAEIFLKSKSNVIAQIHLDFIQQCYSRNCKIIGEKGSIIWEYQNNFVKLYCDKTKKWKTFYTNAQTNDMYIDEMKHFIDCINKKSRSLVDGDIGKKVLEIALAAKKSAKSSKVIDL